jgi:hypothetical protein
LDPEETMNDNPHNHGVMDADGYDTVISTIVPHQREMIRMALCFLPTGAPRILELGCGTWRLND